MDPKLEIKDMEKHFGFVLFVSDYFRSEAYRLVPEAYVRIRRRGSSVRGLSVLATDLLTVLGGFFVFLNQLYLQWTDGAPHTAHCVLMLMEMVVNNEIL